MAEHYKVSTLCALKESMEKNLEGKELIQHIAACMLVCYFQVGTLTQDNATEGPY
jgi:hypothetical protein